jgi:H/ACA ribonucleoprotein complex subunit 4
LVKKEAESNPEYGCKPSERTTEDLVQYGVVLVNKPQGPTSHQISDYVKKILKVKKAGHSGTLDPNVYGLLPTALGRATRIVQVLLNAGKEYVGLMHLHDEVAEERIREELEKYVGEITQLPPIRSAVKRRWRKRNVYYIEIIDIVGKDVLFRIGCQAGTYIRKYIHDFGQKLGCGAHMQELVRTKAGPFKYEDMVTLHDLKDAYEVWQEGDDSLLRKVVLPVEVATGHLSKVWIHDSAVDSMCHGAQLSVPGIVRLHKGISHSERVAIMTLKGELVCIGKAVMTTKEMMSADKGLAVIECKVFMQRGTYAKYRKPEEE